MAPVVVTIDFGDEAIDLDPIIAEAGLVEIHEPREDSSLQVREEVTLDGILGTSGSLDL